MVIAAAAATTTASSSAASLLQPLARSKPPETLGFSSRGPLLHPNSSFTSPKKSRKLVCSWSSLRAFYSAGSEAPVRAQREGIWSIRDDLETLPMPSYSEGLEPEVQESFTTHFFRDRIVRCSGDITSKMANRLVTQLLYLDAVDPSKDIVMYVNCRGGSVVQGLAIFDTMQHIRPDVATVCVGLAASMGAFLLSAGKKGKRYSFSSSRISIQQPRGEVQGWVTDIDVQADEMKHHKATLIGYLALHTGQSLEKIYADTDWDYYMSAKEAKEYGLIDAVIMNPFKALPPQQVSNE